MLIKNKRTIYQVKYRQRKNEKIDKNFGKKKEN